MKIPIRDPRVTIHGAVPTHNGLIEIILTRLADNINLVVIGEYEKDKAWCVINFPCIPISDMRTKVTLDMGTLLRCRGSMGSMSENEFLDIALQELLIGVSFSLFPAGERKCRLTIRGIDQDIIAPISEKEDRIGGLFSHPR